MAKYRSKAEAQRKLKEAKEDLDKKVDRLKGFTAEIANTRAKLTKNPNNEKLKSSLREALADQAEAQKIKNAAIDKCARIQLIINKWS